MLENNSYLVSSLMAGKERVLQKLRKCQQYSLAGTVGGDARKNLFK